MHSYCAFQGGRGLLSRSCRFPFPGCLFMLLTFGGLVTVSVLMMATMWALLWVELSQKRRTLVESDSTPLLQRENTGKYP